MQEESLTGHRDKQVQRPRGRLSTSEEQQKAGAATGRGVGVRAQVGSGLVRGPRG